MSFSTVKKTISCFLIVVFFICGNIQESQARDSKGNSSGALYQKAQRNYYLLKSSKKNRAFRHQWVACIKKFLAVYDNYPSSPEAYNATFTVARLYHQLYEVTKNADDRNRASHFYYKVVSEFRDGRLTDDALLHQGKIYLEKKNYPEALSVFEKILKDYPRGDQAGKARKLKAATAAYVPAPSVQKAKAASRQGSPYVHIKKLDLSQRSDSTRIVIHTGGAAKISKNQLIDPKRVYFNFYNTKLDKSIRRDIQVGNKVLTRLRVSQFDKTTSRLVLDIPANKKVKIATFQDDSKVVIDLSTPDEKLILTKKSQPVSAQKAKPILTQKTQPVANLKAVPVAVAPRHKAVVKDRVPLIVIDPGHGGKDHGATSSKGLLEKNLNLDISKRVKKILETRYGYRVILTRTDDTFIPLDERGEVANEKHADLFVSIHANAAKRRSAHGIETYYLGVANSEQAQETAARENGELVHSVKDDQVQQILASLISTTKINDSALLAGHVQERLHSTVRKKYSGVKDLGVKEGPFFVLHDTNMPSILVEVGFVTNSREERRLRQSDYLHRLASAIAQGVHEFKKDRGPTI
ncbi:MAG: hypothetical protein NPINA01_29500 [Nitrospinaceae bacterium]|nr:MAG: hypothetical protein NPINA01_29500 [Nitrospinaceae bacterium]